MVEGDTSAKIQLGHCWKGVPAVLPGRQQEGSADRWPAGLQLRRAYG